VLWRLCGPKDEVKGKCGKVHNEELYEVCSLRDYSGDQIEGNEMGGACW
jgi:hypothetical protein